MPTIADSTTNILTDFDLCLSLADVAINSQIKNAWEIWSRQNKLKTALNYGKGKKSAKNPTLKARRLKGKMETPELDFHVFGPENRNSIAITMKISNAELGWVNNESEDEEECEKKLPELGIKFNISVNRKPIDEGILKQLDPEAMDSYAKLKKELPDVVFSIEYLFLNFAQVDLRQPRSYEVITIQDIPEEDIPKKAKDDLSTTLEELPKDAKDVISSALMDFFSETLSQGLGLGSVVYPKRAAGKATIPLSGFIFDVNASASEGKISSLDYLGVMGEGKMPEKDGLTKARLAVRSHWIEKENIVGAASTVHGAMTISSHIITKMVMDRILQPLVKFDPKTTLSVTPLHLGSMTFDTVGSKFNFRSDSCEHHDYSGAFEQQEYDFRSGWELNIVPEVGKSQYTVSGRTYYEVDRFDNDREISRWVNAVMPNARLDVNARVKITKENLLSGSMAFNTKEVGMSFSLALTLKTQWEEKAPLVSKSGFRAYSLQHSIGKLCGVKAARTVEDREEEVLRTKAQELSNNVKNVIDQLQLDFRSFAFIPPGNGVFKFSRPRFTQGLDLMLDVIYESVLAP